MRVEVDVGGQVHTVSVEPLAGYEHRFRITIDHLSRVVDAVRLDDATWSLIVLGDAGDDAVTGGVSHRIEVRSTGATGEREIAVAGVAVRALVNGGGGRRTGARVSAGGTGEQRLVAPMPGRVQRVLVAEGDAVDAGQGLVVVEAMKMENELSVPRGGRVTRIDVQEGVSVEAGRLLVVVE